MEINHRGRGFLKERLVMLFKADRSSKRVQQSTNKVIDYKQRQSVPLPASVVYLDHRVSYRDNSISEKKPRQWADKLSGVSVDEAVDAKAANYITSVRERLEREGIAP